MNFLPTSSVSPPNRVCEKDGRRIFSLEIPNFVFGGKYKPNTKSIILRPKQQGKALINSQLRHSLKKVAFPMHYLRDFG